MGQVGWWLDLVEQGAWPHAYEEPLAADTKMQVLCQVNMTPFQAK